MSPIAFDAFPSWPEILLVVAHLLVGTGLGIVYFRSLWWNVRRLTDGRHLGLAIGLTVVRFGLLAGVLIIASRSGAFCLLAVAVGLLIARSLVTRRIAGQAA